MGSVGTYAAQAQLISPGELSQAHAALEGIRNCTQCHTLGQRGIDRARCLDCHTPLEARISAEEGFHATVDANCATCHKEHFGRTFDVLRFDTEAFDHRDTGFELVGAHQTVECRGCHQSEFITDVEVRQFKGEHNALEKTYLGLGTTCQTCHAADSPHGKQFSSTTCTTCHVETQWEGAEQFDHATARFVLTGRHQTVDCASCHGEATIGGEQVVQYQNLRFDTCAACHADPHDGAFGATCQNCHDTAGWGRLSGFNAATFNHEATGFLLVGQHANLDCAACHGKPARNDDLFRLEFVAGTLGNTFPALHAEDCLSCHVDEHDGAFADREAGMLCTNCHTQDGWLPVTFDLDAHNTTTAFPLTGAHLATPCSACHRSGNEPHFDFEETTCQTCHAEDSPHGDQFADAAGTTACVDCHATDGWDLAAFDHTTTDFPLTGQHATVDCASCHAETTVAGEAVQRFRGLETTCASCHAEDQPHRDQFAGRTCETCHTTEAFVIAAFDHNTTRFELVGAHQNVTCASCHREETASDGSVFVRYRPMGMACKDCHGDG